MIDWLLKISNILLLDFFSIGPGNRFSFKYGRGSYNYGVGLEYDFVFFVSFTLNCGYCDYYNGAGYGGGCM